VYGIQPEQPEWTKTKGLTQPAKGHIKEKHSRCIELQILYLYKMIRMGFGHPRASVQLTAEEGS
jgi:hypothetical protein